MSRPPRLLISACLLGERVRYDGRDKGEPALVRALRAHAELVPICPEVEAGLPVPRPPMRLEGDPADPRLVVVATREDHTAAFSAWLAERLEAFEGPLAGAVLKARSPSCGVDSTPVFDDAGAVVATGAGLFTRGLRQARPDLPLVEEAALLAPGGLDTFLARIK